MKITQDNKSMVIAAAILLLSALFLSCKEKEEDPFEGQVKVSFVCDGGLPVFVDAMVDRGGCVDQPTPAPRKPGYSVEGWYTSPDYAQLFDFSTPVTSNLTLYAKWIKNWVVSFDSRGAGIWPSVEVYPGQQIARPDSVPVKADSVFDAWYCGLEPYDFMRPVTSDLNLWARWKMQKYTITFNSMGGEPVAPITVNAGSLVDEPQTTYGDLILYRWYVDESLSEPFDFEFTPIQEDMVLYARYVEAKDRDYNIYHTVKIGGQTWMRENLRTTRYSDGTPIAQVGTSQVTPYPTGACALYGDNNANLAVHGRVYNYPAAASGKLCPEGWRLPSSADILALGDMLGGLHLAGDKLKESGADHWGAGNAATNETGFTALPSGFVDGGGNSVGMGDNINLWCYNLDNDTYFDWVMDKTSAFGLHYGLGYGFSFYVRCLREE